MAWAVVLVWTMDPLALGSAIPDPNRVAQISQWLPSGPLGVGRFYSWTVVSYRTPSGTGTGTTTLTP